MKTYLVKGHLKVRSFADVDVMSAPSWEFYVKALSFNDAANKITLYFLEIGLPEEIIAVRSVEGRF